MRIFLSKSITVSIITSLLFTSCIFHKNSILIRQKLTSSSFDSVTQVSPKSYIYKFQPKDVLQIEVSSYKPEITKFFNVTSKLYPVQENGYIFMPVLDSFLVGGKTIEEVRYELKKLLRDYASDAYVDVRLASFDITILGEVRSPGIKNIKVDQCTILEAIGMAGEIDVYGDRKRVKLIRKNGDDLQIYRLDLTNENMLLSDAYFLRPNDVIYIEPLIQKTLVFNYRQVLSIAGVVTTAYLLLRVLSILR